MFIQKPFSLTTSTGGGLEPVWVPKGSIWFDRGNSYLTRTPSSAGNRKTFSLSCWIKMATLSADQTLWNAAPSGSGNEDMFIIRSSNIPEWMGAGYTYSQSTRVLRDPSAWYHILFVRDSTNTVVSQRALMWINGELITNTAGNTITLNSDALYWNNTNLHSIGNRQHPSVGANSRYGGYLSEAIQLDGYAATPSDFGKYDVNGVWVPVEPTDLVTAQKGTTGFWLDFADSSDLGNDVSGNNNDWTTTNITSTNVSADRCADEAPDTGNYCTWNPLTLSGGTLSEGNTKFSASGSSQGCLATIGASSGKYFCEATLSRADTVFFGVKPTIASLMTSASVPSPWNQQQNLYFAYLSFDALGVNLVQPETATVTSDQTASGPYSLASGDTVGCLLDLDNYSVRWYKLDSGSWVQLTHSTAAATTINLFPANQAWTFVARGTTNGDIVDANFGHTAFSATPPESAIAINTANLAAPAVTKSSNNFLPIIYEGNGTGQRVGNFIPFTDSHTVDNSARFDVGGSDYLARTPSSNGSQTTWTQSLWIKRGILGGNFASIVTGYADASNYIWLLATDNTDAMHFQNIDGGGYAGQFKTNQVFKNTQTWTHLVAVWDTASGGASADLVKLYVNGVRVTNWATSNAPSASQVSEINSTSHSHQYNAYNGTQFGDGYLAEVIFVDGYALDPSVFGQTDTSTGRWIPKEVTAATLNAAGGGSSGFGTNGHYLNFADKNDLGNDVSGNNNDFTESGLDTTNGSNQMYGTPTRNFAIQNDAQSNASISVGNLQTTQTASGSGNWGRSKSTIPLPDASKIYIEAYVNEVGNASAWGLISSNQDFASGDGGFSGANAVNMQTYNSGWATSHIYSEGSAVFSRAALLYATGSCIQMAINTSTKEVWFGVNNSWFDSSGGTTGNPSTGANATCTYTTDADMFPAVWMYYGSPYSQPYVTMNYGQFIYLGGSASTLSADAGGQFKYTPPTDYKALNQDNLEENTAGITGFSWIKNRDAADNHVLQNRVSGVGKYLESNLATIETTNTNSVQRFLQQGVQIGNMNAVNTDAESYVLWQWAADAGVVDSDGMINLATSATSSITVGANATAGFSIIKYTGNSVSSSTATIAHGIGATPAFMLIKNMDNGTYDWQVYHKSIGATGTLSLNTTDTVSTSATYFNDGSPAFSSSTFTLGTSVATNNNGDDFIAYVWAEIEGYSQFGEYTGNGSTDGPVIYLNFKPAFVLIKATQRSNNWHIFDSARNPYNQITNDALFPDLDSAEGGTNAIDFGSNFFKLRTDQVWLNASSSNNYIYAAYAENPFGGSGVNQAKAR